jgi:hypothetical protein
VGDLSFEFTSLRILPLSGTPCLLSGLQIFGNPFKIDDLASFYQTRKQVQPLKNIKDLQSHSPFQQSFGVESWVILSLLSSFVINEPRQTIYPIIPRPTPLCHLWSANFPEGVNIRLALSLHVLEEVLILGPPLEQVLSSC